MTDKYGKIHTDGSRSGGQPLDDSIEQKARDMVLEVLRESELPRELTPITREYWKALCRAIEQHEAFKQEVSDVVEEYKECFSPPSWHRIDQFIIPKPKPDPLFDVLWDLGMAEDRAGIEFMANGINDALKARNLKIVEA